MPGRGDGVEDAEVGAETTQPGLIDACWTPKRPLDGAACPGSEAVETGQTRACHPAPPPWAGLPPPCPPTPPELLSSDSNLSRETLGLAFPSRDFLFCPPQGAWGRTAHTPVGTSSGPCAVFRGKRESPVYARAPSKVISELRKLQRLPVQCLESQSRSRSGEDTVKGSRPGQLPGGVPFSRVPVPGSQDAQNSCTPSPFQKLCEGACLVSVHSLVRLFSKHLLRLHFPGWV